MNTAAATATAAPEAAATRVYVGGVGGSVGEDDLRKIFGALGTIGAVEIVRNKGRSFAYFDFVPATQNALNKLFSKYNGCVWKGGRLKLEKAKEHYLIRLKREWEEGAEQNITPSDALDAKKDPAGPVKAKNLDKEKHLHIFFPRLKKVKSLPFRGSGKHKYSFQKVEVPPLPKLFCDCEEHSNLSHSLQVKKTHELDSQGDGGVNAEELDMMNSVMNKLFQREAESIPARSGNELIKEEKISSTGFLEPQLEEDMVDHDDDEDNLVINMVTGVGDGITGGHIGDFLTNQESKTHKKTSGDGPAQNRLPIKKRDGALPNKEDKSLSHGHGARKESFSSSNGQNDSLPFDSEVSRNSQKLKPVVSELRTQNMKKNPLWSQKSSWKKLLGERNEFAFSVSHVLSGGGTPGDEQLLSDNSNVINSVDCKNQHGDEQHEHAEDKTNESAELEDTTESVSVIQNKSSAKTGGTPGDEQLLSDYSNVLNSVDRKNQHGDDQHEHAVDKTNESAKLEDTTESEFAIQNKSSVKTGRGKSWLHKSSWTQLVTDNKSKSFSISVVKPVLNSEHEPPADNIAESKQHDESVQDGSHGLRGEMEESSSAAFDSSKASQVMEQNLPQLEGSEGTLNLSSLTVQNSNKAAAASLTGERRISVPNQSVIRVDRECRFMRSEASLRDWANSKAALAKSLKRKR